MDRLAAEVEVGQEVRYLMPLMSAFVVNASEDCETWCLTLAEKCTKSLLTSGGVRKVVLDLKAETPTLEQIARLHKSGVDILISTKKLTLAKEDDSAIRRLNFGQAFAASLAWIARVFCTRRWWWTNVMWPWDWSTRALRVSWSHLRLGREFISCALGDFGIRARPRALHRLFCALLSIVMGIRSSLLSSSMERVGFFFFEGRIGLMNSSSDNCTLLGLQ